MIPTPTVKFLLNICVQILNILVKRIYDVRIIHMCLAILTVFISIVKICEDPRGHIPRFSGSSTKNQNNRIKNFTRNIK